MNALRYFVAGMAVTLLAIPIGLAGLTPVAWMALAVAWLLIARGAFVASRDLGIWRQRKPRAAMKQWTEDDL